MTDSDVVSVAASGEEQGEFEEEAASVGAEVSVIVEPEPDTPIYPRPKVAKRHGSQTGTRDIADPHQFDIRGAGGGHSPREDHHAVGNGCHRTCIRLGHCPLQTTDYDPGAFTDSPDA